MIVKNIILDMLPSIWPMLLFVAVVAISIRGAYLFSGSNKIIIDNPSSLEGIPRLASSIVEVILFT